MTLNDQVDVLLQSGMLNDEEQETIKRLRSAAWKAHHLLGHFGFRMFDALVRQDGDNPMMVQPKLEDMAQAVEALRSFFQDQLEDGHDDQA